MIVIPYDNKMKDAWNRFVTSSRNGSFMFFRDYMEYHADRFEDCSLMFFESDRLSGVIPGNRVGDRFESHGGLTYGGLVIDDETTLCRVLEMFGAMKEYLRARSISEIVYKPAPHIYHRYPTEEDLYALFLSSASLVQRDLSTALNVQHKVSYSALRRRILRKAQASGMRVEQTDDFEGFVAILADLLRTRFDTTPVHTAAELRLLKSRFPDRIRLYAAYLDETMLAGIITYENPTVVHTQYIASSDKGKELGAVDLIVDFLLNAYKDVSYFDFGKSTHGQGFDLNEGLVRNKESYGGRSVVYDRYLVRL